MSTVQINGQDVGHGDIIVLMAHPDPMSGRHPLNTYCLVTHYGDTHSFTEVKVEMLQALMSVYDFADLVAAIRDRREHLESLPGTFSGIVALIWKGQRQAARKMVSANMVLQALVGSFIDLSASTVEHRDLGNIDVQAKFDLFRMANLLNNELAK